ncbi:ParB/RepB/Spo0J family partition protein [Tundrisphaera lichenicola]|uniref:ParB/RepB/Spo0J family partition protein n=1 Tax=Tundrisphaera lichenicola TaxID=2029860 RepID=UPI003EBDAFD5
MSNTINIEVKKLEKSPLNARKTVSKAACEEMKASLLAHGLLENLIVVKGKSGKYEVVAGARRMTALKALQDEGKLPADHEVLCQIVDEEDAYEISLAENTVRHAMHPADEHAAFKVLIDGGKTVEDVSQRFGKTTKYVEQRLKLGRAAPELIQEYRDGKITLETLEAFTITDDRKRQMRVYNSVKSGWQRNNPREIRGLLTETMVDASNKLAKFVGLKAYEKASGTVKRDLFGEDVYLENPELLNSLAEAKLAKAAEELKAEGWSWVQTALDRDYSFTGGFKRIEPEPVDAPQELVDQKVKREAESEAASNAYYDYEGEDEEQEERLLKRHEEMESQLDELNEKLESYVRFTPEQMSAAGCYVYIGHSGKLEIEHGLVNRADAKKLPKASGEAEEDATDEKPKGMSESLKRDLEAYRLGAAQAEIAKHPAIAFDMLVFKLTLDAIEDAFGPEDGMAISARREYRGGVASEEARNFAEAHLEAAKAALPLNWMKLESEVGQFLAFQQLSDYQKHALLAYCVAASLKPKLAPTEDEDKTAYDIALSQTGANVADYWRPTKENFLSRITKDQLLEIGKELVGGERGETWAGKNANEKKGDIASELQKAFSDPDRYGGSPEQVERVKSWLPTGMAFLAVPEPKPAKAKKGKKAA